MPSDTPSFDGDLVRERYKLGPLLGRGGQGTTYLALDTQTGRQVAVKMFDLSRVEDWKEFELFQRECRVLAELDHPGIPNFLEEVADEESGRFYLVMERVPGRSLKTRVARDGPLDEQALWNVALQVIDILAHLHVRVPPIVHRDVKPANLIQRPDDQISLVDFGGVRNVLRPDGGSTVVGTFGYMAPEQLHGEALPATDLFALGATLLFLATGTEPEKLPRKGLRIKVGEVLEGCSKELVGLVTRLVEPDPEKRPRSAVHLRDELARGAPVPVEEPEDDGPEPLPEARPSGPVISPDLPFPIALIVGAFLLVASIAGKIALATAEYVIIPLLFAILLVFASSESTKRDLKVRERAFKRGLRSARQSLGAAARQSRRDLFESQRRHRRGSRNPPLRGPGGRRQLPWWRDNVPSPRDRAMREHERRSQQRAQREQQREQRQDERHHVRHRR